MTHVTARDIDVGERSGVLTPGNLTRFSARWLSPGSGVRQVVDTYWSVRWDLPAGSEVHQRVVDHPAITLSIETGDVPAPFVLSRVRPRTWSRLIQGQGSVFAIRLRPAGLAVLSDLDPSMLAHHEHPITPELDARLHALLRSISAARIDTDMALLADDLILSHVRERPLTRLHTRANEALELMTNSPIVRSGKEVAAALGTSQRSLQRALRSTMALGPNDVARRIRMQEVVRLLSVPGADMASVAAELGYVDQSHLIHEFRAVTATTPGRYIREQAGTQSALMGLASS